MRNSFRHDVHTWRRMTASLPAPDYRILHVICQAIWENGGPIIGDERSIAASCNMSIRMYRTRLQALQAAGLVWIEDGQINAQTGFASQWRREPIPAAMRDAVLQRDNFTCTYCDATDVSLECDHVIPVSRGGMNTLKNLVTACMPCNRSKGAKLVEDWLA